MFDFVANHKRLLQLILLLIIVPPFALFGIESFTNMQAVDAGDVAKVGVNKISEREFNEMLRRQQDRMRSMFGGKVDEALLDTPDMRREVLDGMISQRVLAQYAVKSNLNVSDDRVREVIVAIPAFQDNGKFNSARYEAALRQEGLTRAGFDNSLRADLMSQQVASAVSESSIVSRMVAARIAAARAEQREVSELVVPAGQFQGQVKPTPEAIQAYYDANKSQFAVPEQVRVEFVVLSADKLGDAEPVPLDQMKKLYEENKARFGVPEQRQASHILIAFKQGASDAEKAAVRDKAARVLAEVKKSPGSFADLAKKNSDDPGSGAKGGDLGYFGRGMMVKPFDDAVFSMSLNELRGPVESEFGVHIIKLTGIRAGKTQSFEEMRPQIEAALRQQSAGQRFGKAAEEFSNTVYEQSDSLKAVADRFKVPVQQASWTTRQSSPEKQLNNPKLLAALFSDDVIRNKHNTEVVEIAPGTLVSARVVEHKPATQRALEEVRADVAKRVIETEAVALAKKDGMAKLDELKKGQAQQLKFAAPKQVSRDKSQGMAPEALDTVFRADASKVPAYTGMQTPAGYTLYRISKVEPGAAGDAMEKNIQTELGRIAGAQEFRAFLSGLRDDSNISINATALEKKATP